MFDIQKFAEESADVQEVSTENNAEQENLPPIPEEFEGISEEVAREMMAKTAEKNPEPPAEFDEVDDDGNYSGEKDLSRVKIPYSRFKQTIDQKNELATKASDFEKQLALYKQRFGDLDAQPQQQNNFQTAPQNFSQQPAQTQEQPAPQPRYFNADDAKQIDEAIKATAMQMTGFSEEDVDGIDYLDDDDPKIGLWNHAKEMAKIATYNQIVMAQMEQAREEQRRRDLMAQSVNEFQNYTQQQTQAAEYEALRNFAANEFFNSQSPVAQQVIRDADWRLQNKLGTPADFKTIQDFFTMAKYAYDAKNAAQIPQAPAPKPAQKNSNPQFPRTNKINGVPGSGGGVTNASLAEMMHTQSWDKIPPELRNKLMGY